MLNNDNLLEKLEEKINDISFESSFLNYLKEYFQKVQLYKHIATIEEFVSLSGRVCQDYSGELIEFKNNSEIIDYIENGEYMIDGCSSNILSSLYNGQKIASYCSGCGWHYVTVADDLKEYFDDIKYKKYKEWINENKEDILKVFNLSYKNDNDFKNNIYDDLDSTEVEEYIEINIDSIFYDYIENIKEDFIINMLKCDIK